MIDNELKRLSRLTAILIQLQSSKLSTAPHLAKKFEVSVRTIYRDIKALEQAGVPILSEDGKGYYLMDGYRIPPVMFTETEANALITAEKLVLKNKDASFVKEYTEAVAKIKAVLRQNTKAKANLLSDRVVFWHNYNNDRTSNHLSTLQLALTNFNLTQLKYHSPDNKETTQRTVEPFALYSTQENWLLIAWCRLRNEYRSFRLDRILQLDMLEEKFEPHKISLHDYFEMMNENYNLKSVT